MQHSSSEKRCVSESERALKPVGHKWLWAFRFSLNSRDVRRQTGRAGCCTFVEDTFHYIAPPRPPGLCFPVLAALWSIGGDNLIMSAVPKCVCYPLPEHTSFRMHRGRVPFEWCRQKSHMSGPRCCLQCSDERSTFAACFVFNEAVQAARRNRSLSCIVILSRPVITP